MQSRTVIEWRAGDPTGVDYPLDAVHVSVEELFVYASRSTGGQYREWVRRTGLTVDGDRYSLHVLSDAPWKTGKFMIGFLGGRIGGQRGA